LNFLLDMNLPRQLGKLLQEQGHDCRQTADHDLVSADDHEIVEIARSTGEVSLIQDLDFGRSICLPPRWLAALSAFPPTTRGRS